VLIVIGGMIGLGKTSLGELLAKKLNAKMYYESVNENPILPLYYTASPEEIDKKRYPFLLQLFFLNSRFETIKDAAVNSKKGFSVIDRSIYEDWYFAKINYDLGRMSELEFSIYKKLLDNMMKEVEEIPQKAPDLMVYLKGSFETVLKRINSRGRSFELDPELVSYYKLLWSGYSNWLENFYKASDVIIIDMDKYDVVNNKEDEEIVMNFIKEKIDNLKK